MLSWGRYRYVDAYTQPKHARDQKLVYKGQNSTRDSSPEFPCRILIVTEEFWSLLPFFWLCVIIDVWTRTSSSPSLIFFCLILILLICRNLWSWMFHGILFYLLPSMKIIRNFFHHIIAVSKLDAAIGKIELHMKSQIWISWLIWRAVKNTRIVDLKEPRRQFNLCLHWSSSHTGFQFILMIWEFFDCAMPIC